MQSNKVDIRVIGFNKYDKPKIKVTAGQKWVTNGRDNSHYKYLIERYQGSTTHASICNSYIDLIYGKGLVAEGLEQDSKEWKSFLKLFSNLEGKKILIHGGGKRATNISKKLGIEASLSSIFNTSDYLPEHEPIIYANLSSYVILIERYINKIFFEIEAYHNNDLNKD